MDARNSAGRASAPPTRSLPRPSQGHVRGAPAPASSRSASPVPGVDELAPWEMAGQTDRPLTLPEPASAPWQQGAPQLDAPWDMPAAHEVAPWQAGQPAAPAALPDASDADAVTDGPVGIELPPWDEPPPFSFEELVADEDPYDANAPLVDDFAGRAAAAPMVRPRMTAPVLDRPPSRPEMAPTIDDVRSSVFGDIFIASPQAAPVVDDEPPLAAPSDDTPAEVAAGEALAEDAPADEPAQPEEPTQEAAPRPDPVSWPPVPTDFPPASAPAPQARRKREQDPLAWPPIPSDLLRVPDMETHQAPVGGAQASVWDQPAELDHAPPTETASVVAQVEAAPPAPAFETVSDEAVASAWPDFEPGMPELPQQQPAPAQPAQPASAEPVPDDVPWAVSGLPAVEPAPAPSPSASPPQPIDDQPGAVFARFAATGTATPVEDQPRVSTMAPEDMVGSAGSGESDGNGDLWFLASEPRDSAAPATDQSAESEPSTVVTLVAMIIVGLIVIGAVTLFLSMFTQIL
jgi:hypothetical protein